MARKTDTYTVYDKNAENFSKKARVDDNGVFFLDPYDDNGEWAGITNGDLGYFVWYHLNTLNKGYKKLFEYYRGNHYAIMHQKGKAKFKPDNRIVVNLPKQLVKSYVGYFAGEAPVINVTANSDNEETKSEIESADADLKYFNRNNNINHFFSQEAKYVDIFGRSYAIVYQNELGDTRVAAMDPRDGFVVYSDDVAAEPLFAVRYRNVQDMGKVFADVYAYKKTYDPDENQINVLHGQNLQKLNVPVSVSTTNDGYIQFEDVNTPYGRLPVIEFMADDERMGLYEDIISIIDAVDSAISEKKNDVDYFGDAILKIINLIMDEDDEADLRDRRILNGTATGESAANVQADFLAKPTADETQENLITRLIEMIYDISGVVNLNDKDFTNASSGKALKQRLQVMREQANTKMLFFDKAFHEIYECLFTGLVKDKMADNVDIEFKLNEPLDILDESTALVNYATVNAAGLLSKPTILKRTGVVDDPEAELLKVEQERKELGGTMQSFAISDDPKTVTNSDDDQNQDK